MAFMAEKTMEYCAAKICSWFSESFFDDAIYIERWSGQNLNVERRKDCALISSHNSKDLSNC